MNYQMHEKVYVADFTPHLNEHGYLNSTKYEVSFRRGFVTMNHGPEEVAIASGEKDIYGVRTHSFCVARTEVELRQQVVDFLNTKIDHMKSVIESHKDLIEKLK